MEVILDTKKEISYRFQSDCMEPGCAIDVEVAKNLLPDRRFIQIYFWATPAKWRDRIRWCWQMIRHGIGFEHEFIVREQDIDDLAAVISGKHSTKNV